MAQLVAMHKPILARQVGGGLISPSRKRKEDEDANADRMLRYMSADLDDVYQNIRLDES